MNENTTTHQLMISTIVANHLFFDASSNDFPAVNECLIDSCIAMHVLDETRDDDNPLARIDTRDVFDLHNPPSIMNLSIMSQRTRNHDFRIFIARIINEHTH